jgi:cytoskeleton protein RodZ
MIENEEVQPTKTVTQGPGQILKQARERASLSSQDIADKMKLKKALIEDIEQDNYDINISLTFVRGYLKLYAKHVKVAEADILKAFENLSIQKKEPVELQSFSRKVAHQANDDKLMLVTYLIVAAVIALVVVWWIQQDSTVASTELNANNSLEAAAPDIATQEIAAQEIFEPEEAPTVDSEVSMTPSLDTVNNLDNLGNLDNMQSDVLLAPVAEQQSINNQNTDSQSIDTEMMGDTNTSAESAEVANIIVTELAAPVELIFEFSGDCWMNLSDATGENIAYGVKVKGRVMPVTGIPPFIVTLGAPEVVKISYAGESLNMSFLPSGRIAKFDLPLSE